jgi:hypothetical protein
MRTAIQGITIQDHTGGSSRFFNLDGLSPLEILTLLSAETSIIEQVTLQGFITRANTVRAWADGGGDTVLSTSVHQLKQVLLELACYIDTAGPSPFRIVDARLSDEYAALGAGFVTDMGSATVRYEFTKGEGFILIKKITP